MITQARTLAYFATYDEDNGEISAHRAWVCKLRPDLEGYPQEAIVRFGDSYGPVHITMLFETPDRAVMSVYLDACKALVTHDARRLACLRWLTNYEGPIHTSSHTRDTRAKVKTTPLVGSNVLVECQCVEKGEEQR